MKVWATLKKDNKISRETTIDMGYLLKSQGLDYKLMLHEVCSELDLSQPVVLKKHLNEIAGFSRVTFKPDDFMEPVDFDKLDIELFYDKKKE
ncbi:MAG: hypothetical protein IJO48_00710 [Clostridia bacterium]|nr:hypothetical protein [Clostridia bacterium]